MQGGKPCHGRGATGGPWVQPCSRPAAGHSSAAAPTGLQRMAGKRKKKKKPRQPMPADAVEHPEAATAAIRQSSGEGGGCACPPPCRSDREGRVESVRHSSATTVAAREWALARATRQMTDRQRPAQTILDGLTDSMAVFHSACGGSKPPNQNVLEWFKALPVDAKCDVLSVDNQQWVQALLYMRRQGERGGHDRFMVLPDRLPRRGPVDDFVCHRRGWGFLRRHDFRAQKAASTLDSALWLACSTETASDRTPTNLCGNLDTLLVAESVLASPQALHALLEALARLSWGHFLCSEPDNTSPVSPDRPAWMWNETAWFRTMGFYSPHAFVANALELAMWRGWRAMKTRKQAVAANRRPGLQRIRSERLRLCQFWQGLTLVERRQAIDCLTQTELRKRLTESPRVTSANSSSAWPDCLQRLRTVASAMECTFAVKRTLLDAEHSDTGFRYAQLDSF